MSLIPSESLTFPDSFRAAVGCGSRLLGRPVTGAPKFPSADRTLAPEAATTNGWNHTTPVVQDQAATPHFPETQSRETELTSSAQVSEPEPSPPTLIPPSEPQDLPAAIPSTPARIPIVPRKRAKPQLSEPAKIPVVPRAKFKSLKPEKVEPEHEEIENQESVKENLVAPMTDPAVASAAETSIPLPPPLSAARPEELSRVRAEAYRCEIELFDKSQRRRRLIGCLIGETVSITFLLLLLRLEITRRVIDPTIIVLIDILIAALAMTIIALPIMSFGMIARWRQRWQ